MFLQKLLSPGWYFRDGEFYADNMRNNDDEDDSEQEMGIFVEFTWRIKEDWENFCLITGGVWFLIELNLSLEKG